MPKPTISCDLLMNMNQMNLIYILSVFELRLSWFDLRWQNFLALMHRLSAAHAQYASKSAPAVVKRLPKLDQEIHGIPARCKLARNKQHLRWWKMHSAWSKAAPSSFAMAMSFSALCSSSFRPLIACRAFSGQKSKTLLNTCRGSAGCTRSSFWEGP